MYQVPHTDKGLEAILFTAEGDMRNAINNTQSTFAGFGMVNDVNVFKVQNNKQYANHTHDIT